MSYYGDSASRKPASGQARRTDGEEVFTIRGRHYILPHDMQAGREKETTTAAPTTTPATVGPTITIDPVTEVAPMTTTSTGTTTKATVSRGKPPSPRRRTATMGPTT